MVLRGRSSRFASWPRRRHPLLSEGLSKHLQFLKDINETKKGSAPKDIRQKVKELKRKEPELTADLVKAERAQYRGMFHIIYGLKGFIPLSRKMYHQALPTLKQERNNLEKEIFVVCSKDAD